MKEEGKYIMAAQSSTAATTEKSAKKSSKNSARWYKHWSVLGTIGIWLGGVTVSVAYLAVVVLMGTDGLISRIMAGIALSFVSFVLLWVFSVVIVKTFK